ncbi:MAG: class I SAM-dependent methyltransferase [Candidatus Sumerlaeaceae bacterium]
MAENLKEFARFTNDARVRPRLWHFSYPHLRNNLRIFREFAEILRTRDKTPPARLRLLDIGCGFKPFSSMLDPAVFYVAGIDYSGEVSSADALAAGDALPFASDSFDGVILSEVIEHVRFPEKVLAEACRVTKIDGLVFVSTPFMFWEHGIPYDFQRPTRYFYRAAFAEHEILKLVPSNTILWSAITLMCLLVEATPVHRILPLRYAIHCVLNSIGALTEAVIRGIAPHVLRNWEDRFLTAPVGYAMLVRVKK